MRTLWQALLAALLLGSASAQGAASRTYDVAYRVELDPRSGMAHVAVSLTGDRLPSRLTFTIEPQRHLAFTAESKLEMSRDKVVWYPERGKATLSFDFRVDRRLASGSYDSRMTTDWAVFRGDRMIPPVSVRAAPSLSARTTLEFVLPPEWSIVTPYAETPAGLFRIDQANRRFDRPDGWMLAGKIGSRQESIAGISTTVGAPVGEDARRQDTLAFLNWNLPHLVRVFPDFPRRLLVVLAGDPLFRGGLSGPASLFLHAERPLVSENRTSTLLHELTHVAMGIRGDEESDWIVEGFAEFYSLEILRRSGGIGERRYTEAIARLGNWGNRAPNLFGSNSAGPVTARAVTVLAAADAEIRAATGNKASLDEVARELARQRGTVSLERLQSLAAKTAGRPVAALDRSRLQSGK